jgi:hypothetical protein
MFVIVIFRPIAGIAQALGIQCRHSHHGTGRFTKPYTANHQQSHDRPELGTEHAERVAAFFNSKRYCRAFVQSQTDK